MLLVATAEPQEPGETDEAEQALVEPVVIAGIDGRAVSVLRGSLCGSGADTSNADKEQ